MPCTRVPLSESHFYSQWDDTLPSSDDYKGSQDDVTSEGTASEEDREKSSLEGVGFPCVCFSSATGAPVSRGTRRCRM